MNKKNKHFPLVDNITYQAGYDLSQPRPIVFNLKIRGVTMPTVWSIEDGEAMGYAILKNVELCRRAQTKIAMDKLAPPK